MADGSGLDDEDVPERFRHLLKVSKEEEALRLKLYPDVSVIEELKIQCTICLKDVKHIFLLKKKSYKHFILQVVVCKSCMKFYGDGDFSTEEDGDDKYCRWCGQGGTLYLCSKCPSAFCKKCIKQNLERKFILLVQRDDWCCFVCEPTPLYKLRALSWAVDQHLKNEELKEKEAEKRREKLKNTPKVNTNKTRKSLPSFDLSENYFQAHVDSTKVWLKGLTDKINPGDIATTRFNDCANLIPSLSSPSDFTNLSESLVNYVDHQMDALLNFRNELIKGLSKLKHNFERSQRRVHPRMTEGSECEEAMDVDDEECAKTQNGDHESAVGTPADNGDDMEATVDSHLGNGDNMEATVDSHLGNGDNMEATVDSHLGNGDNMDASVDSNADMFGDNSLKEENVSGGRPLIRLRNLSDLIAPGLKKVDSPKRKQGEKSELILLSSDDDEPARVTKDKGVSAKKQNSEEDQVVNPKALKKTSLKLVSKKPEDSGNKTGSGSTEDRQGESTPALVDKKSRRRGKSVESSTEEDQETQNLVENPKAKKLREKLKGKSDNKSGEFTRDESVNKKLKDKLERNSSKKSDEVTRDESVTDEKSDKERGRQSNKKSNQEANDKKSSDEVSQRKFFSSSESEDNESSNERGSKSLKKRTKIDSKSKGQRKDDSTADDDSQPKLFTSSENEDSAPVKKNSSEKDGKKKKDKDKTIEKSETSKKKIFTSSESEPDRAKETAKKKKDKDRTSEKSEPSKKKIFTSSESEQGCDKGTAGEKLKKGVGKMASTAQASKGSTSSSDIDKIGRKSEPPKKKVFTSSESEPDCKKGTVKEKLKKGGGKVTSTPKVALKTSQASEDSASSSEVDKIGEKSEPAKKKIFTSSESEPDCAKGTAENKKDKDKTSEKSDPSKKKIFTSSEGEPDHAKGTVKEKLKKGVGKTASTPKVALKTAQASEDSSSSSGVEKIGEKSEPSKKKIASSESEPDRAKGTVKGKLKKGLGKTTSTPRVALKTAQASEDSTSSSDPLSESSGDNKKKKSPKKVNRSYFSASDSDDERRGKKTEIKKTKKKKKKAASTTDSEVNTEDLLRKKKKSSSTLSKSKKNAQQPKKSKKQVADSDSDDDDDYNIAKLCDFKSLLRKRAHSSGDLTLSEDEDVDKKKERTAAKKKQKKDGDPEETLEDFYDSKDEQEGDEQEMEDLDDTFRREFSHISERYIDDLKGEFLKLSSSDEEKGRSSPEEDKETKKKRKKKPAAQKSKEGRKGKKQYADKLMKMKLDSDSDDLEKGEKKYEQHKKRQAEKKDDSSDDDMPGIKDDPKKKRAAPRKKMFSDSDVSEDDADSEKESTKRSENGSKADSDSDFDDKEEEKSQKQSDSDSDSSVEIKSKKRKRIRRNRGSSSSEDDSDGSGKRRSKKDKLNDSKGRKNIKKILKEDDLKQTTQAALKAEQERKKRIQEKQKLYNQLMQPADELSKHTELTELVLDFNAKTKEKLVVVDSDLVKKLKPHQAEGVKFMWDSCFESLAMTKKKTGSGCILAHCMGLGKSLQVVTLVHTLIMHPEIGVRKVMVVAPLSTVLNWVNEFDKWLKDVGSGQDVNVFHMNKTQPSYRSFLLKDWDRQGGVLIMGYNLLRSLTNPKARMKAAFKKVFQEQLVDPGPDVIICDEGHILKNEKTAINQCMTKIKTRRRIVLTGTPLQNNLVEYHCMVQFVKPNLLGTKKEFTNRFVNPITNGQFEDSTPHDVKIMKRRAHVLHTMLDGLVQRKDYNVLTPYLPPKFEYVIHLKLSDVQVKLYRHYLLNMVHGGTDTGEAPKGKRLFVDFQNLMWICLHPRTLLMKADKDEKKAMMEESDEEGSLKDFIDDGKSTSESDFKTGSSSGAESGSDASVKSIKPAKRKTRGQGSVSDTEELPAQTTKQWWSDLIEEADMVDIRTSSKLFLFFTILKYCEEIGDKLLVFSQSLYTLDIIEYFLDKIDVETQKPEEERCPGIKGFEGSWAKGLDYFRLDGSSACENRESWCKSFNRGENKARLFLISTRAGGLGINLTGANRVIIFDASWNPSFDVQSLFRVYRFGQEKPCYIYRFLSKGTMEEKIYERQVAKLSTSLRVIDEHQIDRHFSHSALAELYMFDPEGSELQGTPVLPKDRLMAELLQSHGDIILSHHQHDSLLQNQEDQELTEEERKAAWTEFENEKTQVPATNYSLGAMASLMVEIRTKLKMQNPTWTDEQILAGTMQVIQRLPDFPNQMAPYFNMYQQQLSAAAQARPQGMAPGTNPMFPGVRMPTFQYPQFNNNAAMPTMQMANFARMANPGNSQNNFPGLNLHQLLMSNYANSASSNSSMVANPKHASGPVIQTVRSLQKVAPDTTTSSTGTNARTAETASSVVLDDSDPTVILD